MIVQVLYSDANYDLVVGMSIEEPSKYVCVYIPDLCESGDYIASIDMFYI